ncbi:MAG: fatty acid desaturase [Phycisphaerales bacterium]|nr:fatty acid desaturase [Phycisphaerales bacterium]
MTAEPIDQAGRDRLSLPDTIVKGKIRWSYALPIFALHLLALLAVLPWFFSWTGVILMVLCVHLFGQAINLCYHRILTHRSAVLPKWLEHFFVLVALCCMEDTPGKWVSMHRYHHNHSDHEEDPHSPLVTFLWSHIGWLIIENSATHNIATYRKFAPDILKDSFYMKMEKSYSWVWVYVAHAVLFFLVGFAIGWATGTVMSGVQFGASLLVWGVFVRTVAVWHITWSVNSLTHLFGYSNYKTDDHSRNNWFVAILTVGEGWHNNHHHDPASASNQHRWWEIDVTYYQIKLLEKLGLASKVIPPRHLRRKASERRMEADKLQATVDAQVSEQSNR